MNLRSALGPYICVAILAATSAASASQKKYIDLLKGWTAETFGLPPSFAPELPKGSETLRFAPGWRKPGDWGFWSYAFVMSLEETTPDKKRIADLLEKYYNGILTMFAKDAGKDISKTPVRVELTSTAKGKYEGKMKAIDAFATFKPVEIRFVIESVPMGKSRSSLRVQLSPQPKKHPIWMSLSAAIADILDQVNRKK
ncbi:MAG TPA: hypothetical protein VK171_00075, partial [Fimbriimonas sp.]|nr:hypothetical protein [Fimbriimonas sp.]